MTSRSAYRWRYLVDERASSNRASRTRLLRITRTPPPSFSRLPYPSVPSHDSSIAIMCNTQFLASFAATARVTSFETRKTFCRRNKFASLTYGSILSQKTKLSLAIGAMCVAIIQRFYRVMHFSAKRGIAIACRLSVRLSLRLSVTLVNCDHIGWNSSKLISPLVSLGRSLFATPT